MSALPYRRAPKGVHWPTALAEGAAAGLSPTELAQRLGVQHTTVRYAEIRYDIRLRRGRARRGKPQPSVRRPRVARVPDLFTLSERQRRAWDAKLDEAFAQCRT
ncbi:MAG TPA: hypothetical protein VNS22_27645 [Geminicoccus sp.]|uniref:hypothetical protein n=1 Tax=Geminicoccus sp. TaxID=2024832 RepID=UPI002BFC7288|nr:hypothetical protein [Geminicoccus sp.]HWL72134.1 hypothetical protein [Geminicoccus sp.]